METAFIYGGTDAFNTDHVLKILCFMGLSAKCWPNEQKREGITVVNQMQ